eukprot:35746-Amphidinium_carterae.1
MQEVVIMTWQAPDVKFSSLSNQTVTEARPSDQCEEQAEISDECMLEVAALFREVGNEVQHREDIFRSKLPALEEMGRALNTSLFGEAKPEVQDEKESGHQDVTELVTE